MNQTASSDTRLKIIEAARKLFWAQGYELTSLADIAVKADVNTGSLYYCFKTKEELLLAVLDRYTELLWPVVVEPAFQRTVDPIERIFAILEGYRQGLVFTNFTHGCPIGNLSLEVGDALPRARARISKNFEGWRSWIRKCLDDGATRLPRELDRESMAVFILSVMEGAVMQSRAERSLQPFEQSVAQLRNYFEILQGRSGSRAASATSTEGEPH